MNDTEDEQYVEIVNSNLLTALEYITWMSGVTSLVTLTLCLAAWVCFIKWRTYRNFVFTNLIGSFAALFVLNMLFAKLIFPSYKNAEFTVRQKPLHIYLETRYCCWLCSCLWSLLLTLSLYSDSVVMFQREVTRKYLKSVLFAVVFPVLYTIVKVTTYLVTINKSGFWYYLIHAKLYYGMEVCDIVVISLVMVMNLLLFVRLVNRCAWMSFLQRSDNPQTNVSRIMKRAAAIFILTTCMMFMTAPITAITNARIQRQFKEDEKDWRPLVITKVIFTLPRIIYQLLIIIIEVMFLLVRTNRETWCDLYRKVFNKHMSDSSDIKLQE